MALTWREAAQTALFIIGMLALFYAAMISSSPELVMHPVMKIERISNS
jgi:hypothetical protein